MPLTRSADQPSETLEQFYVQLAQEDSHFQLAGGAAMLRFVAMVDEMFKETQLWGLTSLSRLVIQNASNYWDSEWFVIVGSAGAQDYYFEYLLPTDKRPWKGAYVKGQAASLEEAKEYLLIAMRESQGWVGNKELERLLQET